MVVVASAALVLLAVALGVIVHLVHRHEAQLDRLIAAGTRERSVLLNRIQAPSYLPLSVDGSPTESGAAPEPDEFHLVGTIQAGLEP